MLKDRGHILLHHVLWYLKMRNIFTLLLMLGSVVLCVIRVTPSYPNFERNIHSVVECSTVCASQSVCVNFYRHTVWVVDCIIICVIQSRPTCVNL